MPRILRGTPLLVIEIGRYRDHCIRHRFPNIRLGDLLHLHQNHGGDLLRRKRLEFVLIRHLNVGLPLVVHHRIRKLRLVRLHRGIGVLPPNQTLRLKYGVLGIPRTLIMGPVPHQALRLRECHIGRRRAIPLIVRNDLTAIVLPPRHTTVRRSQINANRDHATLSS